MAYIYREKFTVDLPIIAIVGSNYSTPFNCTIKASDLGRDENGVIYTPAGLFVVRSSAGYDRFLPRTVVQTGVTGGTSLVIKYPYTVFKVGDALGTINPATGGFTTLGATVVSITPIDAATATLLVSGNITVSANAVIGTDTSTSKLLGVYPHSIDFTKRANQLLSPVFKCGGVYRGNLPYVDASIESALSDLNINTRF